MMDRRQLRVRYDKAIDYIGSGKARAIVACMTAALFYLAIDRLRNLIERVKHRRDYR